MGRFKRKGGDFLELLSKRLYYPGQHDPRFKKSLENPDQSSLSLERSLIPSSLSEKTGKLVNTYNTNVEIRIDGAQDPQEIANKVKDTIDRYSSELIVQQGSAIPVA